MKNLTYVLLIILSFKSYAYNNFSSNEVIEASKISTNIDYLYQIVFDKLDVSLVRPNLLSGNIINADELNNFFNQLKAYDTNESFVSLSGNILASDIEANFQEAKRIVDNKIHFKSCNDILQKGYSTGNGEYTIDFDGTGGSPEKTILCDMTTDEGGWMVIIDSPSTDLSYLSKFGSTADISSTFYSNASYGIGWGTNDDDPKILNMDIPYTKIKVTHSGFYNSPSGGLGTMYIKDENGNNLLVSQDAWTSSSEGQILQVNGITIFNRQTTNISNRVDTITRSLSSQLNIHMFGYTSSYAYTYRYIKRLLVK